MKRTSLRSQLWGPESIFRRGFIELSLVSGLFMAYFATRGIVAGRESEAFTNAYYLIRLQRFLGIYFELQIQDWVLGYPTLVSAVNHFYVYAHMPMLILFATWVFLRHPEHYAWIRNIFLGILAVGLLMYSLIPLAPPRFFTATGFVDTLELYSAVDYHQNSIEMLYNPYAAMPSLHVGFSVFVGIGLILIGRRRIHWALGILYPTLMTIAVVATGNHFILDAVAGFLLAAGAYVVVPRLVAAFPRIMRREELEAEAAGA